MPKKKKITQLRKLRLSELSLVDNPACAQARVVLAKRATPTRTPQETPMSLRTRLAKALGLSRDPTPEELQEALAGTVAEINKSDSLTEEAKEEAVNEAITEFRKALNEVSAPVREVPSEPVNKKLEEELTSLRKRHEQQSTLVEKLLADKEERDLIEKSERLVGDAPVSLDDAKLILSQLDDEGEKAFGKILKRFEQILKESDLLEEFGGTGAEEKGAKDEVEKMASDLMKADPKLTRPQAIAKVYDQHPELYDEALDDEGDR